MFPATTDFEQPSLNPTIEFTKPVLYSDFRFVKQNLDYFLPNDGYIQNN